MDGHSNSTGQDSSKLLDLFGKLSLSKSSENIVKDCGIDVSSSSFTQSHKSPTPSSSSTSSPSPSASSDQSSSSSNESPGDKVQEREAENPSETVQSSDPWLVKGVPPITTPFPDDPIIDVMSFNDCNLDRSFSEETSSLTLPERLGYFSCHINPDGRTQSYRHDKSSARYLSYNPHRQPNINLLEGFSETLNWGRVPPGEMHFLKWFTENSFELTDDDGNSTVDFICYTRMLRSIMASPYNYHDDWIGIAIKVRGSIIIDEIDTPSRQAHTQRQNYNQKASSYAGYKFEELITRRYDGIPRPTHAQGNRDSFYIVSRAKLNNHTILYTNRVDCALNKHQLSENIDEMKFAQIKTRAASFNYSWARRKFFWKNRAITWWIESWLGNIDLIICGDKDENYHIKKITRMKVDRLPNEQNEWSPRTCVSFMDLALTFIKKMVTEELTPYRFYCIPGRAIVCQKINEPVEKFLPVWFINNEEPDDN